MHVEWLKIDGPSWFAIFLGKSHHQVTPSNWSPYWYLFQYSQSLSPAGNWSPYWYLFQYSQSLSPASNWSPYWYLFQYYQSLNPASNWLPYLFQYSPSLSLQATGPPIGTCSSLSALQATGSLLVPVPVLPVSQPCPA